MGHPCNAGMHDWERNHDGYLCARCGEFVPYGREAWAPEDDEDDWDDIEDARDDDDEDDDEDEDDEDDFGRDD
jgi:hypothetical protein